MSVKLDMAANGVKRAARQALKLRHVNPARARKWVLIGREWQSLAAHMMRVEVTA